MASTSRSRRHWPPGLEDQIFIKRPHAIQQYQERAHLPPSYNFDRAEADLRSAICAGMRSGLMLRNAKSKGNPDKEFVIRIETPGFAVVYALIEEMDKDSKFPFMVHTVFDQDMYMQWNEEGKVATMADHPAVKVLEEAKRAIARSEVERAKQEREAEEKILDVKNTGEGSRPMIILYRQGEGWQERRLLESDLGGAVLQLLLAGCSLQDIRVFREVKLDLENIDINLKLALS